MMQYVIAFFLGAICMVVLTVIVVVIYAWKHMFDWPF